MANLVSIYMIFFFQPIYCIYNAKKNSPVHFNTVTNFAGQRIYMQMKRRLRRSMLLVKFLSTITGCKELTKTIEHTKREFNIRIQIF